MVIKDWTRVAFLLVLLVAGIAHAGSVSAEKLSIKATLAERVSQAEAQIAQRMMRRAQTAAEGLPRLELEIDMRLIGRWLLSRAEAAPLGSDAQIAAWIRADLWMDATAAMDDLLRRGEALTAVQRDGMAQLHKLTFRFPDIKTTGDLDAFSRQLAILLLIISNPGPEAEKAPPLMRPTPLALSGNVVVPATAPATRQSDAEMAEAVAGLRVSTALRQQLVALASVLVMPGNTADADRVAHRKILESSLELARGLNANIGVSPQSRAEMEAQLAEGLALFMDPRTRAAGQAKVSALQHYRQTLEVIARLKLTAEQTEAYRPVFGLFRQNPEAGARAIAMLERYAEYSAQHDARPRLPLGTSALLRKSIDDLSKQFAQARTAFPAAAGSANVKEMEALVEEMRRLGDLLSKLDQVHVTLDTLAPFKPRQFGNIERRLTAVATIIAAGGKQREEAAKYLDDVHQLGKTAIELNHLTLRNAPAQLDKTYAGGKLSQIEVKWKNLVTELASAAGSATGEIDRAKMARLQSVRMIYESLKEAAVLEAALSELQPLQRWIDWRVSPADLRAVLSPRAAALSAAVAAFVGADTGDLFDVESPGALEDWPKVAARYQPLTAMVIRCAAYREQCRVLPNGFIGLAAALMTPLDGAPFGAERRICFAVRIWKARSAMGDSAGADHVISAALK